MATFLGENCQFFLLRILRILYKRILSCSAVSLCGVFRWFVLFLLDFCWCFDKRRVCGLHILWLTGDLSECSTWNSLKNHENSNLPTNRKICLTNSTAIQPASPTIDEPTNRPIQQNCRWFDALLHTSLLQTSVYKLHKCHVVDACNQKHNIIRRSNITAKLYQPFTTNHNPTDPHPNQPNVEKGLWVARANAPTRVVSILCQNVTAEGAAGFSFLVWHFPFPTFCLRCFSRGVFSIFSFPHVSVFVVRSPMPQLQANFPVFSQNQPTNRFFLFSFLLALVFFTQTFWAGLFHPNLPHMFHLQETLQQSSFLRQQQLLHRLSRLHEGPRLHGREPTAPRPVGTGAPKTRVARPVLERFFGRIFGCFVLFCIDLWMFLVRFCWYFSWDFRGGSTSLLIILLQRF